MALRFDAVGDSLTRTTGLPTITSFTIMGWFMLSVDRNDFTAFFAYGNTTTPHYYTPQTTTNGTTLSVWNGLAAVTGSSLTVGAWNHIALTVSGTGVGQCLCYLNGALDITTDGDNTTTAGRLYIGNDVDSEFLNGRCAAIKVYDAVLTAAEILQEMRQCAPFRTSNLNMWLPCVDPTVANNATDVSGAGNNMTVNGTLAFEQGPPIPWRRGPSKSYVTVAAAGTSVPVFYYYLQQQGIA